MTRPRFVLDTNVYIRALLDPGGGGGKLVKLFRAKKIQVLTSSLQIAELVEVALRINEDGRHNIEPEALTALVARLEQLAERVTSRRQYKVSPDSDDDFIIAIAVKGKADYLVSENQKHVHQGLIPKNNAVKVVTIKAAFAELKKLRII